ncbi:glycosyltransferase [Zhouia amylolytica]|uniref:Glycosyltransferase n=1 Tax=Zhouia amylolytica AD3 TaxID=1286632 RepID=W2UUQ0_9FLAO|nr:glycosyltransferase [Zhouia amylolytica]ETN97097.1 glycosyltransferase [Zhouia amylolytica AD3]
MKTTATNKKNKLSHQRGHNLNWMKSKNITDPSIKKTIPPEVLIISTYPPRECGIATYTKDLVQTLNRKFDKSFSVSVCALETLDQKFRYSSDVKYKLNTHEDSSFNNLAETINKDINVSIVVIQHEFGLFREREEKFIRLLDKISKPIIVVFHTVLPNPDKIRRNNVKRIASLAEWVIVMTKFSEKTLQSDYGLMQTKILIIPHGTHLIDHIDKELLKERYELKGKKVLSTFGLLGRGKNIESTLEALPSIINTHHDVIFLIIGKTHPSVLMQEGDNYRLMLEKKVSALGIHRHVKFINEFLHLNQLLEYLQLTDVYLFTSNDPFQAVSGTFSYAISCGCPIVSTPIPHAKEVLKGGGGIIVDFESPAQLANAVISLLDDRKLRDSYSSYGLHEMASTAWENSAIKHALLFEKIDSDKISLIYNIPPINLKHLKKMTTDFGMLQFSIMNKPDSTSGYTLDDNARALLVLCQYFKLSSDKKVLDLIEIYFNFIEFCFQKNGRFLNYVKYNRTFSKQNETENLDDANGRAIWTLGYFMSMIHLLPSNYQILRPRLEQIFREAIANAIEIKSTRSMAFIIKGLYYSNSEHIDLSSVEIIRKLSDRLVQMYRHESRDGWFWFESYFSYANSVIPEALLCSWMITKDPIYKEIAKSSFDFLISYIFKKESIRVISNKSWINKTDELVLDKFGAEQPIDIAYTILALSKFYEVFEEEEYYSKMIIAFNWFLGANHLRQIIYNPHTGGCYDGLEQTCVNLNQGAESTVSYLLARLTISKAFDDTTAEQYQKEYFMQVNR